ncbi:hypothetical protein INP83_05065 [Mucilaginibacter sp. 21P]|nr:hypothetical protein INP83_05065 [Mucilaginibacter sp. 21P]
MLPLDIIKKAFKSTKHKITSNNSKVVKFTIASGLDFNKTQQEIFNGVVLLKPELNTEIKIIVEQLNTAEMTIK